MKYYVFRNTTLENLFGNQDIYYSGYDDILNINIDADIFVWFYLLPLRQNQFTLVSEIQSYFNNIQLVYNQIPSNKTFLIFTLQEIYKVKFQQDDFSVQLAINKFNANVIEFATRNSNLKIVDFSDFTRNFAKDELIDWKYFFISQIQINPKLAKSFRNWFSNQLDAIKLKRKKCLVLDLDNTLWGGVLGEDGIDGIKVGGDYPGNAFSFFQQSLLALSKSGIILTVCSKNNEQDVVEVWEKNPFLTLKKEHFAAHRINWNNKADNIRDLANELNIGLDSLVFVDDNPTERELIKQLLPMVGVPDFPENPYQLPVFFETVQRDFFSIYTSIEEDKSKTEQYHANSQRQTFQKKFSDISDYLTSLEIDIQIQKANSYNISRIAQMTQKTNQFNLTTKRYTDADIQGFVDNDEIVYCISVKDKFGDNGITGALIIKVLSNEAVEIDSFLLSCRILGKGIEKAFVYKVLNSLKEKYIKTVRATFIATNKNEQVNNFYERMGFILFSESNESKQYEIELQNTDFSIETYYKIEML